MKQKTLLIRTVILAMLVVLVLLLYILRLMNLQVVEGETLAAKIEEGWNSTQTIKATRGEILDRNGLPMAVNTIGRDVVIDMAYLKSGSTNEVILRLTQILSEAGEEWIDNLPITKSAPFSFLTGETYDAQVAKLKETLVLREFATVDDCIYHLREKYDLQEMSDADFRRVAGVRYEMTRTNFSMSTPYTLATNIKIETVPKIKERGFMLQGVDVVETPIRQYVSGDIAPHVIGTIGSIYKEQWDAAEDYIYHPETATYSAVIGGREYTSTDQIGKSGIELAFEKYLKGIDGKRQIVQNSRGDVIEVVDEQPQVPGHTVITTIDSSLQKVMQDSLEKQIKLMQSDPVVYPPGKGHEADAGAAVAIDVKTGEVLGLATYPSYNLATYKKDYASLANPPAGEPPRLINRALDGQYTPGSIFKPVVALTGINEGIITKLDTVFCGQVYDFFGGGWKPKCLGFHGALTVVDALRVSCNIFFYDVGRRAGIDLIDEYAARLGLGQPTGIELSESIGRVSSRELKEKIHGEPWQAGDVVQASIGQFDTLLTPLQLANYCATLANNGKRMKVTALKSVRSYGFHETIYEHEPEVVEQIDAPEAFAAIREGMVAASSMSGTSWMVFGNYKIPVASKTGTPETARLPNSTFIAYAPVDDPQIAVCVVIEKGWHGYTGAPVARDIFDAYFSKNETTERSTGYGRLLP